MGVLIVAEPPPVTSPYTNWKCYRSTTKSGSYTVQNGTDGQAIADLSFYDPTGDATHWYKISYWEASPTESGLSDPMQGLTEIYTTVKKVESFLMMGTPISDSTTPSVQQVIELINRIEDEIDYRTGHAWRLRYSGTPSGQDQTQVYESYDVGHLYEYQTGMPVYLKHRMIRTLDATAGDVFEIWNGSEWEDWIANKTEGRSDDFWVDYEQGIIYVKARWGAKGPTKMRMKYRYGETTVNRMIENIATKMVAVDILSNESKAVILPEGNSSLTYSEKIELWKNEAEEKLVGLKEIQHPNITSM